MALIELKDVSYTYANGTHALENVSLSLEEGSFTCILGSNGSGKSTLAQLLNALLVPSSGTVKIAGLNTAAPENIFAVRSKVGMVFQNPDDQIVASLVADDVAFGPENLGVPADEIAQRVSDALARVGLAGFEQREITTLSGGQKQRVAIAAALAMEPRILVLDEASAMLDPQGARKLAILCRKLNREGLTIVAITHAMDEAALADRVIILHEGTLARCGQPAEVLRDVNFLREMALDVPFAAKMSELLRARGVNVPLCLTEDALVDALRDKVAGAAQENKSQSDETQYAASREVAFRDATPQDTASQDVASQGTAPQGTTAAASSTSSVSSRSARSEIAPEILLSFEDVSFSYLGKNELKKALRDQNSKQHKQQKWGASAHDIWALENINLNVHAGDFVGIAGHTGSGKSTLAQLGGALLQPTNGHVYLRGEDLAQKSAAQNACRSVGVVFQYPERQLFAASVFDDVAFGPRNLGLSANEVATRVDEALAQVHLDARALKARNPFTLSGGQQRRVAIAGILAMDPQLLVLDEPAAGLDPAAHAQLLQLVCELQTNSGKTVLLISHDMDDLATYCNRVIVLNQGRIVARGTPAQVFAQAEDLTRIGLGLPHTSSLQHALGMSLSPDHIVSPGELADQLAQKLACETAPHTPSAPHSPGTPHAPAHYSPALPQESV